MPGKNIPHNMTLYSDYSIYFSIFSRCEKLTKINILHVAINYIRALESILETGDAGIQVYGTSVVQSPNLPLSPECEPPMVEKVAKNPPKTNPSAIRKATLKKVVLVSNTPTT